MQRVLKINYPEQLSLALAQKADIIRFGEEFCRHRAEVVWPVEELAAVVDFLRKHQLRGELAFLSSPTSVEEEKYHEEIAAIIQNHPDVVQPLINDWGSLKKYAGLKPVGGERLFIYNSYSLSLLDDLKVTEFYLPPDLTEAERNSLIEICRTHNIQPALSLLPPVLLTSWTCLYRETTKHFTKTCLAECHPQPPTLGTSSRSLFSLDGHVVKGTRGFDIPASEKAAYGRILEAEI